MLLVQGQTWSRPGADTFESGWEQRNRSRDQRLSRQGCTAGGDRALDFGLTAAIMVEQEPTFDVLHPGQPLDRH
jgi:hypothetical protein